MKKFFQVMTLVFAAALFIFAGCENDSGGSGGKATVDVTGVSITAPSDLKVSVGKNIKLTANIIPASATNKKVEWSFTPKDSKEDVSAKVTFADSYNKNSNPVYIKGEEDGVIIVTVETDDGGYIATCEIEVVSEGNFGVAEEDVPEYTPPKEEEPETNPGSTPGNNTPTVIVPSVPVNAKGTLTATGGGWFESAWLEWEPYQADSTYNVYVKGENLTDWTKLDKELIRGYSKTHGGSSVDYFRADALGLKAGTYQMKVEVDEDTTQSAEATGITVNAYDRTGFAFHDNVSPGAYKLDGTLKEGAKVVYVSKYNCNTVTLDIVTDGKGKTTQGVGLGDIFALKQKGFDTTPLAVRIIGTISLSDIDSAQLLSDEDGLQLKGKASEDFNVTLEGVGEDAVFHGFGMTFYKGSSAEMRNIGLFYFNDDGIQIKETKHIWVHNLDIFYGKPGSAADQKKGDGSLDAKDNSQYTTFSYNHFWDSGKMSLCGMKKESGPNYMTYHHNWFDHSDSRHPRIRTMSVHVYNNYYDGNSKYGVGAAKNSNAFVEGNYFRNVKFPMMSSLQGNDVYAGSSKYDPGNYGTFSGEDGGVIKSWNNKIDDNSPTTSYWAYNDASKSWTKGTKGTVPSGIDLTKHFDAWEAANRDDTVPDTVVAFTGGTKYSNFDTDPEFYIKNLVIDDPDTAKTKVVDYAGRMRKTGELRDTADFWWDLSAPSEDTNDKVIDALSTAIQNYKSATVKTFAIPGSSSGGGSTGGTGGSTGGDSGNTGGTGGSTGENTGGTTGGTTVSGTITYIPQVDGTTKAGFAITGNTSTSKGSVTVNGTTYSTCLKMESSTRISFTIDKAMKLTLVFVESSGEVKIDGTNKSISSGKLEETLTSGLHTITKKDGINLFYLSLE